MQRQVAESMVRLQIASVLWRTTHATPEVSNYEVPTGRPGRRPNLGCRGEEGRRQEGSGGPARGLEGRLLRGRGQGPDGGVQRPPARLQGRHLRVEEGGRGRLEGNVQARPIGEA